MTRIEQSKAGFVPPVLQALIASSIPMALKSTIFKADVQLVDIDHGRHSGNGVSSYLRLTL